MSPLIIQLVSFASPVTSLRGSPLYLAPEILKYRRYDARADLWSVGVILFECLYAVPPFAADSIMQLAEKITSDTKIKAPSGVRVSHACKDLLQRLLQRDPEQRLSFEEFFAHPFLDLEHMPSEESYSKGVALVSDAVDLDGRGDKMRAYEKYVEGLRYLVPCLSHGTGRPEFIKQRNALRMKVNSYIRRAEELKDKCNVSNLTSDEERALLRAYDIAFEADELAEAGYAEDALAKYREALEVLVPTIGKFKGSEREAMYRQVQDWVERAEKIKITCDADRELASNATSHKSKGSSSAEAAQKTRPWITLKKRSTRAPNFKPISAEDTFLPTQSCRVQ